MISTIMKCNPQALAKKVLAGTTYDPPHVRITVSRIDLRELK